MKPLLLSLSLLLLVGCCKCKEPPVKDDLRQRLFRSHMSEYKAWVHPLLEEECKKKCNKLVDQWEQVSRDVINVQVMKTIDTDSYVITFIDGNGKESSLWLNKNGTIRSISSY